VHLGGRMLSARTGVADRAKPWFAWGLSSPPPRPSLDRRVAFGSQRPTQQSAPGSNETPRAIVGAQIHALGDSRPRAISPRYLRCSSHLNGRAAPASVD